ncbi:MAG: hypothetical protein Q8S13_00385, partial [Dehalococcoidia bacterium]|nr:hypothetical protein [Dehalococcoidia bacterium]
GTCECGATVRIGARVSKNGETIVVCPRCAITLAKCGVQTFRRDRAIVIKHLAGIITLARCGTLPETIELVRVLGEADADVAERAVKALDATDRAILDAVCAEQAAASRRSSTMNRTREGWANQ